MSAASTFPKPDLLALAQNEFRSGNEVYNAKKKDEKTVLEHIRKLTLSHAHGFLPWKHMTNEQLQELALAKTVQARRQLLSQFLYLDRRYPVTLVQSVIRREIFLDLCLALLHAAWTWRFNALKTETCLELLLVMFTHCIEAEGHPLDVTSTYKIFEQLLLNHCFERPPFSICIFTTQQEAALLVQWFQTHVLRHLRKLQYVFGVQKELILLVNNTVAQQQTQVRNFVYADKKKMTDDQTLLQQQQQQQQQHEEAAPGSDNPPMHPSSFSNSSNSSNPSTSTSLPSSTGLALNLTSLSTSSHSTSATTLNASQIATALSAQSSLSHADEILMKPTFLEERSIGLLPPLDSAYSYFETNRYVSELQDKLAEESLQATYRPPPLTATGGATAAAAASSSAVGAPYGGLLGAEPSTPLSSGEAADFEKALEVEMAQLRAEFEQKIQAQLEDFNKRLGDLEQSAHSTGPGGAATVSSGGNTARKSVTRH